MKKVATLLFIFILVGIGCRGIDDPNFDENQPIISDPNVLSAQACSGFDEYGNCNSHLQKNDKIYADITLKQVCNDFEIKRMIYENNIYKGQDIEKVEINECQTNWRYQPVLVSKAQSGTYNAETYIKLAGEADFHALVEWNFVVTFSNGKMYELKNANICTGIGAGDSCQDPGGPFFYGDALYLKEEYSGICKDFHIQYQVYKDGVPIVDAGEDFTGAGDCWMDWSYKKLLVEFLAPGNYRIITYTTLTGEDPEYLGDWTINVTMGDKFYELTSAHLCTGFSQSGECLDQDGPFYYQDNIYVDLQFAIICGHPELKYEVWRNLKKEYEYAYPLGTEGCVTSIRHNPQIWSNVLPGTYKISYFIRKEVGEGDFEPLAIWKPGVQ